MKSISLKKFLLAAVVILIFSGFFPGKNDIYFEVSRNIDLFSRVYKEISFNYVEPINPKQFMRAGIEGMLDALDPYTIYMDENKKEDIDLLTNGKYGGIGISIGVRGDNVTIVEVMDGYSAQKQGIRIGDVLFEANGIRITPANVDQISSLVKGEPGTTVEVKVTRNDGQDTLKFNLIREEVSVKTLTYSGFYPKNSNNVYLKLTSFSRSSADEIKNALIDLKAKKEIKSIILDLRGNPGGLLDVVVDICDKFLPKGKLIVTTRGRDQTNEKNYYATQEPLVGKAKLVVLINGGSASASEILAGAMQDHDRGVILGTKSFGKGLVQTITPLDYNTSLKITTAKYYTPSGRCIQKVDYTKNNNVFTEPDSIVKSSFMTDNNRKVYSGGGITPDTTITFELKGEITKDLLAKGFFFTFADHYYYLNPKKDFYKINGEDLFKAFESYLGEQKYVYHSNASKEIDNLIADISNRKSSGNLTAQLENVKKEFEKLELNDLINYKDEILSELDGELASRYLGNEGRIEEFLQSDVQFKAALNIVNNQKVYNWLLR